MHVKKDTGTQDTLRMGDITQATGVSDQAVRHYERLGLIRSTGRTSGGFRLFGPGIIQRIRLIKELQGLDFSLEEIRTLIQPVQKHDPDCKEARAFLTRMAGALEEQIRQIRMIQHLFVALEQNCGVCGGPCTMEHCLNEVLAASRADGLPQK